MANTRRPSAEGPGKGDLANIEIRDGRPDQSNAFTDLGEREFEVRRLIANGVGNFEIAVRLYISEQTVKNHLSNILNKLHLADRTQAAAFAWREGVTRR